MLDDIVKWAKNDQWGRTITWVFYHFVRRLLEKLRSYLEKLYRFGKFRQKYIYIA